MLSLMGQKETLVEVRERAVVPGSDGEEEVFCAVIIILLVAVL